MHKLNVFLAILTLLTVTTTACLAADQDDGIGFEKPISDDLQRETNISYIIQKSKAQAGSAGTISGANGNSTGVGNINLGAGSRLRNVTIINNSNNDGATAINDQ